MAKTHAPITSFGAELHATLREGAQREVRITFPDKNLAIRFRQRINALRHAMKAAKHQDWEQMYRCGVRIDHDNPCILIIAPKDKEFGEYLKAAGVPMEREPLAKTEVVIGESSPGNIDSFLADLTDATSVQKVLGEDTDGASLPPTNLDDL